MNAPTALLMPPPRPDRGPRMRSMLPYVCALAIVAVAAVISWALRDLIADESLSMVFLSAVLVSSVLFGRNVGIVGALIAFLSYNVLILEPRFSFSFAPLSDTLTLAVFFAAALLTGNLAGRVRDQALAKATHASTMTMLFKASQALARPANRDELTLILAQQVAIANGNPAHVFVRSGDGIAWAASGTVAGAVEPAPPSAEVAVFAENVWTSVGAVRAAISTAATAGGLLALPLGSIQQPMGLLVCELPPDGANRWMTEQTLGVFCELGAIALERAHLIEEMTKSEVLAQTDKLRTALLSSISHDFRTPLSGILASATALIEHGKDFPAETGHELLEDIRSQTERLNRYVASLLDMIKLESQSIVVKLEPTDAIEIIAAASLRFRNSEGLEQHGWMRRVFPAQSCLVEADPVLLEQAIFNVLENAILYSAPGSPIEVSLHSSLHLAEIVIADEGPGIPVEDLERVFDKFYRVSSDRAAIAGTGLGLPICRGLVEAMGGSVRAVSPLENGRGTAVHICLRRVADA